MIGPQFWPSIYDIQKSQTAVRQRPNNLNLCNQLWRTRDDKVWIPKKDHILQLRILIASHTGRADHRASSTTFKVLRKHFFWDNIEIITKKFVDSCLHSCATSSGLSILRPLSSTLHARRPSELLHFDYCHMGKGEGNFVYTLIMKDDLSGYVWLRPCESTDTETTAQVLVE